MSNIEFEEGSQQSQFSSEPLPQGLSKKRIVMLSSIIGVCLIGIVTALFIYFNNRTVPPPEALIRPEYGVVEVD